ncbi:J domain-containing protein [Schaalia sp. ZJ405]|uniref:molecular chaperone DnaJ n=1 Tax=Schaalia sp. ZJ405 TaxID=2709403 RepID=UPI0013EA81EE|nr:J domain-containing protein [Schaalia sp. ZJ405]QPK80633.1 J domain-containing protein [Schaalia sp. ZJ405]
MNDYYEILGVSRDASQEDIKKAYRKMARKLHPDYAGPESEDAFKDLSVAYETLSDPQKRQLYDVGGPEAVQSGGTPFAGGAGGFSDIFDAMFGGGFSTGFSGGSSGPASRRQRGRDQRIGVDITLEEATFGASKTVKFGTYIRCETCGGQMTKPGTKPETCSACHGTGSTIRQVNHPLFGAMRTQTTCSTCQGYGTTIAEPCPDCAGQGRVHTRRSLSITIPAGADEGTQIRISGEAEVGTGGGPQGDLYVVIREKKHAVFDRRGDDIHTWITIPMTTAALGTDFELDTLDGKKTVTIEPGTQPNADITLRGLGVGRLQRPGRGDMHVHIDVEVPKKLDDRSRALLEELASIRKESRLEPHRKDSGFFGKLRETFAGQ